MGTVEPAVRTVYGSSYYRWGSEGGFSSVRARKKSFQPRRSIRRNVLSRVCPRSVTEFYGGIVFFPLYQARKYVLTSWYCNSEIHSFCPTGYYFLLVSSFSYWGMGTVEPAARTVYGSSYRWGSEGGFSSVRTSEYQYVQGKKVFSQGGP